jgi:hypothetical protein
MTLGGFTAYLRISRARVASGFNEIGQTIFNGEMEMEGELSTFYFGSLKENLRSKQKAEAYLEIDFDDQFTEIYHDNNDEKYFGEIRLREDDNEVVAYVHVTLPCSMFSVLKSMDGDKIKVDTIHDLISNTNNDQKTDNIVALVKRIYFEISNDLLEEKPRRKFSISFG